MDTQWFIPAFRNGQTESVCVARSQQVETPQPVNVSGLPSTLKYLAMSSPIALLATVTFLAVAARTLEVEMEVRVYLNLEEDFFLVGPFLRLLDLLDRSMKHAIIRFLGILSTLIFMLSLLTQNNTR